MADLLDIAAGHLADQGANDLSLRAIARDLGMVSSAVYRYVSSRDELLTLLILRAYNAVGEVAETARATTIAAGGGPAESWLAVARAIRSWATRTPHEYALIYGSPVRGYRAPAETVTAAIRLWAVIADILREAVQDGSLRAPERPFQVDGLMSEQVATFAEGFREPPYEDVVVRSLTLFTSLFGAISAELFGHFVGFGSDEDRVFDLTLATAAVGVGLDLPV